jgi:hypothetical protein
VKDLEETVFEIIEKEVDVCRKKMIQKEIPAND